MAVNYLTLLTELKLARNNGKSPVEPAAIPMRPCVFFTIYRTKVERTEEIDDRTVAITAPALMSFDSLYETMPVSASISALNFFVSCCAMDLPCEGDMVTLDIYDQSVEAAWSPFSSDGQLVLCYLKHMIRIMWCKLAIEYYDRIAPD